MMPSQLGARSAHASMMHVMSTPQRSQNHTDRKATKPVQADDGSEMSMPPDVAEYTANRQEYIIKHKNQIAQNQAAQAAKNYKDTAVLKDVYQNTETIRSINDPICDVIRTNGTLICQLHFGAPFILLNGSFNVASQTYRRICFAGVSQGKDCAIEGYIKSTTVQHAGFLNGFLGAEWTATQPASDTYSVWTLSAIATATLAAGLAIGHAIGKHKKKAA